jgi:hypothetical protein
MQYNIADTRIQFDFYTIFIFFAIKNCNILIISIYLFNY